MNGVTRILALIAGFSVSMGQAGELPVTVADVVSFATMGDPGRLDWSGAQTKVCAWSPDLSCAVVIVRFGDPLSGENVGKLLWFRAEHLDELPPTLVEFRSTGNSQPIAGVRWLPDSTHVLFGAARGAQPAEVFRLNVRTRELTQLTHGDTPVKWFDVSADGNRVALIRNGAGNRSRMTLTGGMAIG